LDDDETTIVYESSFQHTLMTLFNGQKDEQVMLIYDLLNINTGNLISKENLKIFLQHLLITLPHDENLEADTLGS
jgi:hypothetical protein